MSVNINKVCDNILDSVRRSNLNFVCQETPYSVYLTIRKSWRKHKQVQQLGDEQEHVQQQVPPMSSVSVSQVESNLRCELEDVKAKLEAFKHLEDRLRAQLDAAAEEVNCQKEKTEKVIIEKHA